MSTPSRAPIGAAAAIIAEVAKQHGLTPEHLREHRRVPAYIEARREVYVRLSALGWSSVRIARLFDLDHSTILYALRRERR
jgi:chromosomal replication initiation ATPase DnaA